jgi:hypothetical protein
MRLFRLAFVALVVALPAQAQTRVIFAPQIGLYIPTEKLQSVVNGTQGAVDSLEGGISFGARLGATFGQHLGFQVSGTYVPTTYTLGSGNNGLQARDAKIFTGAAQLLVFLLPLSSPVALYVSGGVGVINRGGAAFAAATKSMYISPVAGAGAGIRLGGIGLSVGAEYYPYNADYIGTTLNTNKLKQKDIQLKFGFGVPFGVASKAGTPK